MKQNKDKQMKGFESSGKEWAIGWIIITFAILLGLGIGYVIVSIGDLKQELKSCQDKVPVWTFKMACSLPFDVRGYDILLYSKYFNYEQNFTNYKDYLTMKRITENSKDCEVIE